MVAAVTSWWREISLVREEPVALRGINVAEETAGTIVPMRRL